MSPARRPAPLPPTAPSTARSSPRSSFSNQSTTLEPIKTPLRPFTTNSPVRESPPSPTTSPTPAAVRKTIKVVEPIREKSGQENCHLNSSPKRPRKSTSKIIIGRISDGFGFVCYLLCMCCVLSGGRPPATRKSKRGHYYQYDDDYHEPAPRVKQMDSPNNLEEKKRCND